MSRASDGGPRTAAAGQRANELELGLSLGGRIVTAEDFPSFWFRNSTVSSNSSVSSSSSCLGDEENSGSDDGGSNREADVAVHSMARSPNSISHSQVVGWPPIRTCRRNNLVNMSRVTNSNVKAAIQKENFQSFSSNATVGNDGERRSIHVGKSRFVKVNMDGDLIGRKVDLYSHDSYETLAFSLEAMFYKPTSPFNLSNGMLSKQLDGSFEFVLIYEDEDGDWMLVGDVPWGMFLNTARRLRIMKSMDSCGVGEQIKMKQS